MTKKNPAIDFFIKHGVCGIKPGESKTKAQRRCAELSAKAETIATQHGWYFEWENDPEEYQMGDAETERPAEVLNVVMRNEKGTIVGSLSEIGMTGNMIKDRNFGRVIEADLALEYAIEKGLLKR